MSAPISHSPAEDADEPVRGRPVVRLKPKAEARALRHGFPWVYADELVTDRRTQNLAPGALAVLEDGDRRPLGLVTVNTKSKIIARMLDRDPEAQIDQAWFEARLSRALSLRARLHDAPFYRLENCLLFTRSLIYILDSTKGVQKPRVFSVFS